jgi:AraC-like DNA-binding protein
MVPSAHEMTAPWGVRFGGVSSAELRKHAQSLGLPVPPEDPPATLGAIVAVLRGSCCLEVEQYNIRLPLLGGDVVLVTRNDPFILCDTWQTPARNLHDLLRREHIEHLRGLHYGGGGVPTTFLSGAFCFEDEEDLPLLSALPPVIHVRGAESDVAPWLESTLRFLTSELATRPPGSPSIANHLAHVLFVQAVRAYAASLPEDAPGSWFHAIFDSELAPALGLMHLRPEEPWTVASLAEQAKFGRSAFAARFTAAVGSPPLQYLTQCRMRKARMLLRDTNLGVKTIAAKVGYSNESAFSHAFKRATGMSPGTYRQSKTTLLRPQAVAT